MESVPSVKIEVFIPEAYLDALDETLFQAGAGKIGDYDHCKSITRVEGTWRPLEQANPFMGKIDQISHASEVKVEVNCAWEAVSSVLQAIRKMHPYEEPVINVLPLLNHLF